MGENDSEKQIQELQEELQELKQYTALIVFAFRQLAEVIVGPQDEDYEAGEVLEAARQMKEELECLRKLKQQS